MLGIPLIIERNVNSHIVELVCSIQRKIMHGTQCHEVQRSNKTKIMRNAFWKTHETYYNLDFFLTLTKSGFLSLSDDRSRTGRCACGHVEGPSPLLDNQATAPSDTSGLANADPEGKAKYVKPNQWNTFMIFGFFSNLERTVLRDYWADSDDRTWYW